MPFWGHQAGIGTGSSMEVKLTTNGGAHVNPGGTATAKYQLNSNGKARKTAAGTGIYEDIPGEWLLAGLNTDFECQFTKISGEDLTSNPGAGWLSLSTTREGTLVASGTDLDSSYTVEIRRAVDSVVVASATITWAAYAT